MQSEKQMKRSLDLDEIIGMLYMNGFLSNKEIRKRMKTRVSHQLVSFRLMDLGSIGLVRGPLLGRWDWALEKRGSLERNESRQSR